MSEDSKINFKGIGKGVLFSLFATIVFVLLVAVVTYFSDVADSVITILLFMSSVVSVFIGGLFVAKNADSNGIFHGLILGVGYYIIIFTASVITKEEFSFSANMFTMLFADVFSAMLGGILGINTKK